MTRVLRAAWSRRGTLATLAAMTAVVVAGTVVVVDVGRAGLGDGSNAWRLALPLLLLGVVAVPEVARVLAARRREEVGLHRLRGLHGVRLLTALLAEPLLAIVVGATAGLAAGLGLAVLVAELWLGRHAELAGLRAVGLAVAVAAAALLVVALGTVRAMREPLGLQVSTATRPRRAGTLAVFGHLLVIVAAVVAAYRSGVGDDPDAVVLLGPALVGLAAGQLTVWLVRFVASVATARTTGSALPGFLAARRLARQDDVAAPLRLLVATSVVAVVSLTGATSVLDWADDQARMQAGAQRFVPVERITQGATGASGAVGALRLSHELDPDGEHLMAAAVLTDDADAPERRAFVDLARYDAVVGDLLDGTAAELEAGDELASGTAQLLTGTRVDLRVRVLAGPDDALLRLTLGYLGTDNLLHTVVVEETPTAGLLEASREVAGCRDGCLVSSLEVERLVPYRAWNGRRSMEPWPAPGMRLLVEELSLTGDEDHDLLEQGWLPAPTMPDGTQGYRPADERTDEPLAAGPDGLEISEVALLAVPASSREPLAVAAADVPDPATVETPGGVARESGTVTRADALPFVGTGGLLADLPAALSGDAPTIPAARTGVLVGADAPDDLVVALTEATGTETVALADVRDEVVEQTGARRAVLLALMGVACLPVALLVLASAVGRQRAAHRAEVAALRVVGVPAAVIRSAARRELLLLGGLTGLGVGAGSALAVALLLGDLPLVDPPAFALPVDLGVSWPLVLAGALLAALAVVLLGARGRAVPEPATRPAALREGTESAGVVA